MPNFTHQPVLLAETLAWLRPRPAGMYADFCVGGAGHAAAILAASSPSGKLFACDRDGRAVEVARERLRPYAGRFEIRQGNFADAAEWMPVGSLDGIVADLGVSSPQIDEPMRGFSFQADAPLDMRMDTRQALRAADVVNGWTEAELARVFFELGEEPQGRRFARAIVQERQRRPITTTGQLAALLERLAPRRGARIHPATRAFMAIRMAVNDEIRSLENGLAAARLLLKSTGRLAVISFCSTEHRAVKRFGDEHSRPYTFEGEVDVPELRRPKTPVLKWVSRKAIQASAAEIGANPRARSAQLRVLEKL